MKKYDPIGEGIERRRREAIEESVLLGGYLRLNPCATEDDVRWAGYLTALDVLYDGSVGRAAKNLLSVFERVAADLKQVLDDATF